MSDLKGRQVYAEGIASFGGIRNNIPQVLAWQNTGSRASGTPHRVNHGTHHRRRDRPAACAIPPTGDMDFVSFTRDHL